MPVAGASRVPAAWWRVAVLGGIVGLAAVLAFMLRRAGHTEGDDFALYIRQARSLFDGDTAGVVDDNRFAVLNSDPGFSPIAYPWGWPVLLAPFVRLWGFDYDRLKLVEIGTLCVWLVLLHGIVRRRLGRIMATAMIAVIATAPAYLRHADQLLAEIPHLAAVAIVLWWHDRIRARSTLITASCRDLVALGLLMVLAFNVRRESVVLVAVVAVMQLVDVWQASRRDGRGIRASIERSWRALVAPALSFVVGVALFQLLLPTELLPDNGNGLGFVDDRWRQAPEIISDQLGLGDRPVIGLVVIGMAVVGAVVGVRRRPLLDTPLLLLALFAAVTVGTHFRRVDRYWLQITPLVLFFVASAALAGAQLVVGGQTGARVAARSDEAVGRRHTLVPVVAVTPFALLVILHAAVLPGDIADVRDANAAGVQDGPAHPAAVEMFEAVDATTPPDAVVAFYRARTMTLLTDRLAFQTHDFERIRTDADYWVQRRNWSFWQPGLDEGVILAAGMTQVWSNDRYVIWCTRCPDRATP